MYKKLLLSFVSIVSVNWCFAQNIQNNPKSNHGNKFEQLGTILPDANNFRTASGAPGNQYWQQKADYEIDAFLNEKELKLEGSEKITYFNNSPDNLNYLWLQLDENEHHVKTESNYFDGSKISKPITDVELSGLDLKKKLDGYGVNIISVTDSLGNNLPYTINNTMMRIDLPKPLLHGEKFSFSIKFKFLATQ
jgi:hypothetical protein